MFDITEKLYILYLRHPHMKAFYGNTSVDGYHERGGPDAYLYYITLWDGGNVYTYSVENWFTEKCAKSQFECCYRQPIGSYDISKLTPFSMEAFLNAL